MTTKMAKELIHNQKFEPLFKILRNGRAYTLLEISKSSKISKDKLSHLLSELITKEVVQTRGNRQRAYYFINNSSILKYLNSNYSSQKVKELPTGMKYCRHCYQHLAGYIGVKLENALIKNEFIVPEMKSLTYTVTEKGWEWFGRHGIYENNLLKQGGRITKQCLDFSERKSHLGGKLGDALLSYFLKEKWAIQVENSREIKITDKGKQKLKEELDLHI